jgi:hypothetical protein
MMATCGDGMVREGTEACDATEVGRESCVAMGYDGGVLLCGPDCQGLDTSNCHVCGNGLVEPGEECDGGVGRTVCADLTPDGPGGPWDGGAIGCSPDCRFDESQCCHGTPGEGCTTDAQCCGDMLQCADGVCCIADGGSCAGMTSLCCSGTCDPASATCAAR